MGQDTCQAVGVEAPASIDGELAFANLEVLDAQVALRLALLLAGGRVHLVGADGEAVRAQRCGLLELGVALQRRNVRPRSRQNLLPWNPCETALSHGRNSRRPVSVVPWR